MKARKIETLINYVTKDFIKSIKENGYDNFLEMKESYWWTSKDIKEEVEYMVNHDFENTMFDGDNIVRIIDKDLRTLQSLTYKEFINNVYK